MRISKIDRYQGTLVGVLAGDALGAPYETWSADRVKADLERRGGLVPFDYPNPWAKEEAKTFPMGRPTDDSDQTAALAESLIANRGVNQEDIFRRMKHVVFDHVSPLWEGKAYGAGGTTRKTLRPETWEESKRIEADWFPSNGSLMRCSPLALFFGSAERVDSEVVRVASEVTHRHPLATECCDEYVRALAALLEGRSPEAAIRGDLPELPETDLIWARCNEKPRDPEVWPGRGAAVLTFHAALWALTTSENFRDGITKVVALGGDTDTYAAVAGGLLGAHFGIDGIPEEWRSILKGGDVMSSLADQLFALSQC